jgi:hypothetical protein
LGISFNLPIFNEPVLDAEKTNINRFTLFCRDSCSKELLAFNEELPNVLRFIKGIEISLIIFIVSVNSEFYCKFSTMTLQFVDIYQKDREMYSFALLILAYRFAIPIASREVELDRPTRWKICFLALVLGPIIVICLILGMGGGLYVVLGSF